MRDTTPRPDHRGAPWPAVALLAGLAGGVLGAGMAWTTLTAAPVATERVAQAGDDALAGEVRALSASIEELRRVLAARASDAAVDPRLVVPSADPTRRANLEPQAGHQDPAVTARHLFWIDQDLLDAYGAPDRIAVQDGVEQWTYKYVSGTIAFALHLHRVVGVYWS